MHHVCVDAHFFFCKDLEGARCQKVFVSVVGRVPALYRFLFLCLVMSMMSPRSIRCGSVSHSHIQP